MTRREFFKKTIKAFSLFFSVSILALFSFFAYPGKRRKKKLTYFYFSDEDALPVRGVRQVYLQYPVAGRQVQSRAFVINNGRELFALSPTCSHLGCLVNWNRPKNRFLCPCHGGQYDMNGQVIQGPPPAPLSRLPMRIEDGKAYIGLRV